MKTKLTALLLLLFLSSFMSQAREIFPEKGFYLSFNFTRTGELHKITQVADRAKKAGYNTVYLADSKFGNPWTRGEQYEKNVKQAVKILRERDLKVAVYVCAHGQFLQECPFEAECVPVQEQEFSVLNGKISGKSFFSNSSFEEGLTGWRADSGKDISIDSTVCASGKNSLRFRIDPKKREGQIRIRRALPVAPFKQYTLSLKLKTRNMKGRGSNFGIAAQPVGVIRNGKSTEFRYICYQRLNAVRPILSTQDCKNTLGIMSTK